MKWYDSVRVKLLGFFIIISIVFLISIIITFFLIRENNLEKNATDSANLATSSILQHIKINQTKAEEIVLTLASVVEEKINTITTDNSVITAILSTDEKNSINIISGGIWFEPYTIAKDSKNYIQFYNRRNDNQQFELVKNYFKKTEENYRDMKFYHLAKNLKSGDFAWTNVYIDPVTHIKMITVVSPIYKDRLFIGTASVDIEIGKKFMNNVKSKYMYLMMIDKDGNFIGKSDNLSKVIQSNNIYTLKNSKMNTVVSIIKPVLTHIIKHTQAHQNVFLNKIHLIKDDPLFHDKSVVAVYHFPNAHWNVIIGIVKNEVMAKSNETFKNVLIVIILLTLLATILGYIILRKLFVDPIQSINTQLKHSFSNDSKQYTSLECKDKGEIGLLVDNLNTRSIALEETQKREANEISRRLKNEKMLLQQSKMAAMGEMMDAVAHQWKQPLNALSMYSEIIKSDFEDGSVDKVYIDQFRDDMQVQIDHMVNTLDEFRTFFRPNKEYEMFSLLSIVHSVLFLTKDDLLKNRITVTIEKKDHIDINGSSNEFKHLLLNIINNAKDAFNDNNIEKRVITIRLINDDEGKRMEVEDNAGGIPEDIIDDIFKANITSKEEGKGTGIGLYMSTQIATKYNAELLVKNKNGGACFTIVFNHSQET